MLFLFINIYRSTISEHLYYFVMMQNELYAFFCILALANASEVVLFLNLEPIIVRTLLAIQRNLLTNQYKFRGGGGKGLTVFDVCPLSNYTLLDIV